MGQNFVGQDVTGAISLRQKVVGQEISGQDVARAKSLGQVVMGQKVWGRKWVTQIFYPKISSQRRSKSEA